ncbi:DUF928 domain-containing protein [Leptolyngbya sp. PCC 6406]|uniref:DUF928 domain-containing protein n=1 Tax=Leptolyngbya sp. PCC 6406 TaxID=1173264 RepID=UPI0002AC65C8|nr:DUF928 domain-containing protein [Leptolyngbya sp. PCC 6406]
MHLRRNSMMLAIALTLGLSAGGADAALSPGISRFQLGGTGATLELALRLNLGSRPSRYRVGGFRRSGSCLAEGQELVPLVPPLAREQADDIDPVDLTVSSSPTLWVHVPDLNGAKTAQFTLQDELGTHELVSAEFELSGQSGVVGIKTSSLGSEELQVGEIYYWQMAVECNVNTADGNPVVSGWISRTTLAGVPVTGTPSQQATFYAENGIWQDAVSTLATARYQDPANGTVSADWRSLMESAGLVEFSGAPVVQVVE